MDRQTVATLEERLEAAIANSVSDLDRAHLPVPPSKRTLHLMAKAAIAVYEAAVENASKGAQCDSMAYSESLATRIRQALTRKRGVAEKKMFGGVGFLLNGNLLVGVWKDSLIVRLGPEQAEKSLREPHVAVFDITGRAMKDWVLVEPEGIESEEELHEWLRLAARFVGKLPAK